MKYVIFLCSVCICTAAFSQFQLKGIITAADTKKPLAAASVFLSNTSYGTQTDSAGQFLLSVPSGRYDLIASFVGYETHAQTVSNAQNNLLAIELRPKAQVFDEVVVDAYEKDGWKNWGKFFTDNFIGTSDWAAGCSIKNYKVIKFRRNKKEDKLYALATDQLLIENEALGYTVKYQLEEFEYDFNNGYLVYLGYPLFTEMQGSQSKQNRWNKRRQEAYYGSVMEFMRALYRNKIVEEGYQVRRLVKTPNEEKKRIRELYRIRAITLKGEAFTNAGKFGDSTDYYDNILRQPDEISRFSPYTLTGDSIAYKVDSVTAGLEFGDYLYVVYTRSSPPEKYRRLSSHNKQMSSELNLVNLQPVEIQSNGNYYPPLNLLSTGYWAWAEKISGMLPLDYKPPSNRN